MNTTGLTGGKAMTSWLGSGANMERKTVVLNGSMVFVDAIESITPTFGLNGSQNGYTIRCKSGKEHWLTKTSMKETGLI